MCEIYYHQPSLQYQIGIFQKTCHRLLYWKEEDLILALAELHMLSQNNGDSDIFSNKQYTQKQSYKNAQIQ